MFDFIFGNWIFLAPIIALSILSVYLIVERGFYFLKIRERDSLLERRLIRSLRLGKVREGIALLKGSSSVLAGLLLEGLRRRDLERRELEERLEARGMEAVLRMEKHVSFLSGIANIATLLGLFGTVTGMIRSFNDMNEFGISDPSVLAGGISQALVTTAAGLGVAIPALLFYNVFTQFIKNNAARMEMGTRDLLAWIYGE